MGVSYGSDEGTASASFTISEFLRKISVSVGETWRRRCRILARKALVYEGIDVSEVRMNDSQSAGLKYVKWSEIRKRWKYIQLDWVGQEIKALLSQCELDLVWGSSYQKINTSRQLWERDIQEKEDGGYDVHYKHKKKRTRCCFEEWAVRVQSRKRPHLAIQRTFPTMLRHCVFGKSAAQEIISLVNMRNLNDLPVVWYLDTSHPSMLRQSVRRNHENNITSCNPLHTMTY